MEWPACGGGGPGGGAGAMACGAAEGEAVCRTPERGSAACWIDG